MLPAVRETGSMVTRRGDGVEGGAQSIRSAVLAALCSSPLVWSAGSRQAGLQGGSPGNDACVAAAGVRLGGVTDSRAALAIYYKQCRFWLAASKLDLA